MLVAGFLFATAGVFVKIGSLEFGAAELGFYRSFSTVVIALIALRVTGAGIWSPHMGTHLMRGLVGAASLIGYFYAITQLPLATAVTLNYTSPLFLAITTTAVMRERFSPWLVLAIALGFAGVGLLLQPNFQSGKEGAAVIGLLSGVLAAWAYLSVRALGRLGEPDWRTVFWFGAVSSVVCAGWHLLSAASFSPLTADNVWVLSALAAAAVGAQLAMTRAYRTGHTLVVGAFSYSTVVFATVATILIWSDTLTWLEWCGIAVIIASGILAMRLGKKEQVEEAGFEN